MDALSSKLKEEVASKEKLAREGSGLRSEVQGLRKDLARKGEEVQAIRKDATNKIRHVEWQGVLCVRCVCSILLWLGTILE